MVIVVNPGTGPVPDATYENARANIKALLKDAGVEGARFRRVKADERGDGRFCFVLSHPNATRPVDVLMPGWPLERVRYLGPPQDIYEYPRLYVDGGSWVWKFAINSVRRPLSGDTE